MHLHLIIGLALCLKLVKFSLRMYLIHPGEYASKRETIKFEEDLELLQGFSVVTLYQVFAGVKLSWMSTIVLLKA